MNSQTVLYLILFIVCFNFLLERILEILNQKAMSHELPKEAEGIYDKDKYAQMLRYEKETGRFSLLVSVLSFSVMVVLLATGFFGYFDGLIRYYFGSHPILTGLFFFALLGIASDVLTLPFSLYSTFVIEEKYGFNKTTLKTFFTDKLKGWLMGAVIGGGLYALIVWLYLQFGKEVWIFAWAVLGVFMVVMNMFYASWILPLFNTLTPLKEGSLREKIEGYCKKIDYPLSGLFVMDGSKRSSKANAFFSGLGKKKKIVLFDTLLEKLEEDEIVAVLAHEVGHYKKKHIQTSTVLSIFTTGLYLFIFTRFLGSETLAQAMGDTVPSFHISLIAFGFLFTPISMLIGLGLNILSRKNEYEADAFAKSTFSGKALEKGLKKLTVDSLGNLTPHPAYVFFHYSHPPVLKRLKALKP